MKLAIITPLKRVRDAYSRDTQLLLPQLLQDERYVNQYTTPKPDGQFRIMDNGVAEGCDMTSTVIYKAARMVHADEVVINDVYGDGEATQRNLECWEADANFGHMYVVHGRTIASVFERALYAQKFPFVTCIGLPRVLFDTVQGNRFGGTLRGHLASVIKANARREIDIHLLGSHPLWYNEAHQVASNKAIRSMDTSLPYYLAMYGHSIQNAPVNLRRPKGFFRWEPESRSSVIIAKQNTKTMDEWITHGRS